MTSDFKNFKFTLNASQVRVEATPTGVSSFSSWDCKELFRGAAVLAFVGLLVYAFREM